MRVHSEHIPDDEFAEFLRRMPQVSRTGRQGQRRDSPPRTTNKLAADGWFLPGTRLYKGETFEQAIYRLADEEFGVEVELGEKLGVYNHFWETVAFPVVDLTIR